jgi:hypothetical protein
MFTGIKKLMNFLYPKNTAVKDQSNYVIHEFIFLRTGAFEYV